MKIKNRIKRMMAGSMAAVMVCMGMGGDFSCRNLSMPMAMAQSGVYENEAEQTRMVTGLAQWDSKGHEMIISYENRPAEADLIRCMPETIEVYLDGDAVATQIPVSWYCVTEDYETTRYYYTRFSPVWDEETYPLAEGVNVVANGPYIPVFFEHDGAGDDGVMTLSNSDHVDDNANMKACYKWLKNNTSFHLATICGILANIQIESNFNPGDVYGDSYGIIQWTSKRKEGLYTYCDEHGLDYTTVEGQLAYMMYEIQEKNEGDGYGGYSDFEKALLGVELSELGCVNAAYIFTRCYERCANKYYILRQELAHHFWDYFTDENYITQANLVVDGVEFPDVIGQDDAYALTGKVSADYTITGIKTGVAIYEDYSDGSNAEINRHVGEWVSKPAPVTVNPDSKSYNLAQSGKSLAMSSLTVGETYTFYMSADVKGYGRTVIWKNFTVKAGNVIGKQPTEDVNAPSAPKISAALKSEGIKISWEEVAGADSYVVYRKSGSGDYKALKTTKSTTRAYTDKTVVAGTKYTYGVKAVSDEWQTKRRTLALTYIPPLKVTASNKKAGVKLSWDAVSNVTGYKVYRKLVDGKYKCIATCGSDKITYTDSTAESGQEYAYSIVGFYEGTKDTYLSVKKWSIIGRVESITPTITNRSDGLMVKWDAVKGAGKYVLYRCAEGGTLSKLKELSADELSYLDEQVVRDNGALYYYAVKAVMGDYSGANVKTGYYRLTEVQMTGLVNKSTLSCQVNWFSNNHSSGYQVQIATNSKMTKNKKTYAVKGKNSEEKLIDKLTKDTKYYVRIRACYEKNDKKYYSAWCKTGTVTIKK